MAFALIEGISINGSGSDSTRPIFGGYIYSVSYDVKIGHEGSSSVTVSVISPDGNYLIGESDLRLDRPYTINIGNNIVLTMYLFNYKLVSTTSGKLLEIEFTDGSFQLDRYFVGLHKKQGYNPDSGGGSTFTIFQDTLDSCVIIVGHEKCPCDRNYDGSIDNVASLVDPCHPCGDEGDLTNAQLIEVDCQRQLKYDILPVVYNFSELITKLRLYGFNIAPVTDPNPLFFESYIGTVRDVLRHWCSDFGWIFYWEEGVIRFKDLRTVIDVNATIEEFCPNIVAREDQHTLEGTQQGGLISNFSRPGKGKEDITCQAAAWFDVPVYTANKYDGTLLEISKKVNETAAAFNLYSDKLRCLYYWFIVNGITDFTHLAINDQIPELGFTALCNPIFIQTGIKKDASIIDWFSSAEGANAQKDRDGNIRAFLSAPVSSNPSLATVQAAILRGGNEAFKACFEMLKYEDQWKAAVDIDNKYFFMAYHDIVVEEDFTRDEYDYASNFLGKYHVFSPDIDGTGAGFFLLNNYIIASPCNGSELRDDGRLSYASIELGSNSGSLGGSFKYYANPNPSAPLRTFAELPFAKFLRIFEDSDADIPDSQGNFNFRIVVITKDGNEWFPSQGAVPPPQDQAGPWQPAHNINNQYLIDQAFSFFPKQFNNLTSKSGQSVIEVILDSQNLAFNDTNFDKASIGLFMGTCSQGFKYEAKNDPNPKVAPSKQFDGRLLNPDDPVQDWVFQYPALRCLRIGNADSTGLHHFFTTPPAIFDCITPTFENYGVVIERTKIQRKHIDKVETVMRTGSCPGPQAMALSINLKDISDNTISDINRNNINNSCQYDLNTIANLHAQYALNLIATQTVPLIKKSFTIAGIDIQGPQPTIGNGLQGIRIQMGENGLTSTYAFGTTKMVIPEKDEVYIKQVPMALNQYITDPIGIPVGHPQT